MLKLVVVAVDGSDCANRALDFALSLAKAEGSTLAACSVADPSAVYGALAPPAMVEQQLDEIEAEAVRAVDEAVAKATAAGIPVEGCVLKGDAIAEILLHAEKVHADAIVTGTHGRSGLTRLLMGSVAEGILRSAPIPVVTVRADARIEDPVAAERN
jgi:nucleotide-binding universal stress UspA family protein